MDLSRAKRRRGAARASVTRLNESVDKLEAKSELTRTDRLMVSRLVKKLEDWDAEFRKHHDVILDLTEEDTTAIEREQAIFDEHDEKVTQLSLRLQVLGLEDSEARPPSTSDADTSQHLEKRLRYISDTLETIRDSVSHLVTGRGFDDCLLQVSEKRVDKLTSELSDVTRDILCTKDDERSLMAEEATIEKELFALNLKINRLRQEQLKFLESESVPKETKVYTTGVKLPKISVPSFKGDLLDWSSFWEQFNIAIHSKEQLTDAEKLAYLKDSLKDGPARHAIEGLAQTAENYEEAITCLRKRYDRPRLIHQAHVRAVVEAPPLKDGSGRELRRLHDVINQHMRAITAMTDNSLEAFVTSIIETKLDRTSMFAWQDYSHESRQVPSYEKLLEFLDRRAQATENTVRESERKRSGTAPERKISSKLSYATNVEETCIACKSAKHPLYGCKAFKGFPHSKKLELVRENGLCLNCLKSGHFANRCPCTQKCKKCQKPHHSWLHIDQPNEAKEPTTPATEREFTHISQLRNCQQVLLMTCQVLVIAPDGSTSRVRALLDSASSASFITERLTQRLRLPRRRHGVKISGIGGATSQLTVHGTVQCGITRIGQQGKVLNIEALVLPRITSDLPSHPVPFNHKWKHLLNLTLADPDFGTPGSVDLLLGADTFSRAMLNGRRHGPSGSPSAFKTHFGWVLAGAVRDERTNQKTAESCYHSTTLEEMLRRFWETEDYGLQQPVLSLEERAVVEHFKEKHSRDESGRFIVPLPIRSNVTPLGESRSVAVKRFESLERSLRAKGRFEEFAVALNEYMNMDHAEPVPMEELCKPVNKVYYLPMHMVRKESSTTSKVRIVFDASATTGSGASLNDQLLVGPTVHSPLIDVLLRFRRHKVALAADVSRMYRAVLLPEDQRDLHRFVWRDDPRRPLIDYRMKRLTFGVSASSFAANMAIRQNALDHEKSHPQAAQAVLDEFYVDDGLTGEDSIEKGITLQTQLQELFGFGGFALRKWRSNESAVLAHIPSHLLDSEVSREITPDEFVKVLGVEWNASLDSFRPTISSLAPVKALTKRKLVSDIARLFDVLGWCSPTIIKPKIMLQRLWEDRSGWDEPVSRLIQETWEKWRAELPLLRNHLIPRHYYRNLGDVIGTELHGFSDASELAYAAVVYLRSTDTGGVVHSSIVTAKTKVSPIKRVTIPRLELCGALVVAKLLHHCRKVLNVPLSDTYAWTDSTIVLSWLRGNPNRFKPFVGNRVAEIMEMIPPSQWNHISGMSNPADCASRGLYPSELANHALWWEGPSWLRLPKVDWPTIPELGDSLVPEEEKTVHENVLLSIPVNLTLLDQVSSLTRLYRITAWIRRFINNCRADKSGRTRIGGSLTTKELAAAEIVWVATVQQQAFAEEINTLKAGKESRNKLLPLRPFLDQDGLLRVGGRLGLSELPYSKRHPLVLPGKHQLTKLVIRNEHTRLLHAGPVLVMASLSQRFHIIGARRAVRAITRNCVACRRIAGKPHPQLLGQLPRERLDPGLVFDQVGVDYAGPILTKSGSIRKPIISKGYICVFVSFSVKAVHIEPVTELTTAAFIAALRRFTSRRGKPSRIWSDHGTNFVGAARELKELYAHLRVAETQDSISSFCSKQGIEWCFTPEHAPHFGGLWEAAVKSLKHHFRRIVGSVKLTFEELTTVSTQIEACLNSRPLTPLPHPEDGTEVLTPGHFLVGAPLEALPDSRESLHPLSTLRRWHLCQALVRHLWQRWSTEYLCQLQRFTKWQYPSRNLQVGDVVCVRGEQAPPTKWPLAIIEGVNPGEDGRVRVVTIRTAKGSYKRPVVKIVPLIQDA